jgi:hypothetical protein
MYDRFKILVKTSLMLLLKNIIAFFLSILIIAGFIDLFFKGNNFLTLLANFLTMQYNISLYYWSGLFAVSYLFFYFLMKLIMKILDLYDNWR